jgi:hypothetical protein
MKLKSTAVPVDLLNYGFVFARYFSPPLIILLMAAVMALNLYFPVFADAGDAPAYTKNRLPYKNFMKTMQHLTTEDLSGIDKVSNFISKVDLSEDESGQLTDYGKKIYDKYKAEIDELIKNYDKILDVVNPLPSEAQYAAIRSSSPVMDFRYTRSIARVLAAASRRLESEKRYDEALKLTTLAWRFGQMIQNGDGGASMLITAMIGIAVKNIAAQENICRLLIAGDFDAGFYRSYSARLLKLIDDEMDMSQIMYCERRSFLNILEYEVFVKSNIKTDYSEMVNKIPADRLEEGKKYSIGIFNAYYDSVSVYLTKYKDEPYILRTHLEIMSKEISERGQPSMWKLLSPIKSVGDILLAIAMPNFSRAYDQFLRSKYYPYGAAILAKTLAEVKGGAAVPESPEALEKLCGIKLIPDYFNKNKGPLVYKKAGDNFVLYSYGVDYHDDNADSDKDIILFKIPAGRKGE